jgi:hypothetical protein
MKTKMCPDCGKKYIALREYTDGSKMYVHKKKKGLFGITEINGCFINKQKE